MNASNFLRGAGLGVALAALALGGAQAQTADAPIATGAMTLPMMPDGQIDCDALVEQIIMERMASGVPAGDLEPEPTLEDEAVSEACAAQNLAAGDGAITEASPELSQAIADALDLSDVIGDDDEADEDEAADDAEGDNAEPPPADGAPAQ